MLFPPVVALRQLQNVHKGKAFGTKRTKSFCAKRQSLFCIPEISFLWKVTGFHWWRSSENTLVGKSMVKGTAAKRGLRMQWGDRPERSFANKVSKVTNEVTRRACKMG